MFAASVIRSILVAAMLQNPSIVICCRGELSLEYPRPHYPLSAPDRALSNLSSSYTLLNFSENVTILSLFLVISPLHAH
jgi:hypothetical protein